MVLVPEQSHTFNWWPVLILELCLPDLKSSLIEAGVVGVHTLRRQTNDLAKVRRYNRLSTDREIVHVARKR
jgi:hypothetical protein